MDVHLYSDIGAPSSNRIKKNISAPSVFGFSQKVHEKKYVYILGFIWYQNEMDWKDTWQWKF